jgi:hypothetical protein
MVLCAIEGNVEIRMLAASLSLAGNQASQGALVTSASIQQKPVTDASWCREKYYRSSMHESVHIVKSFMSWANERQPRMVRLWLGVGRFLSLTAATSLSATPPYRPHA